MTRRLLLLMALFLAAATGRPAWADTDTDTPTDTPVDTFTASPTATPSATATSTPTLTQVTTPQIKGNFVNGKMNSSGGLAVGWTKAFQLVPGATPGIAMPVTFSALSHSAPWSAEVGSDPFSGEANGDSTLWQSVRVSDANPVLSFWYWPYSEDDIQYDWQRVEVTDPAGNLLELPLMQCLDDEEWQHKYFDLGKYKNQTVLVKFSVHGDDASDPTTLFVDDVSMVPRQGGMGYACTRCGGSFFTVQDYYGLIDSKDNSGIWACGWDDNVGNLVRKFSYDGVQQISFAIGEGDYAYDIAQDNKLNLYVSNNYDTVYKVSRTGAPLYTLSLNFNQDNDANGVACDKNNNVYVTEVDCSEGCVGTIEEFDSSGNSIAAATDTDVAFYEGLAYDPNHGPNGLLYACVPYTNSPEGAHVRVYDAKTLNPVFPVGFQEDNCPENGSLSYPTNVTILPGGFIAVTDWTSDSCDNSSEFAADDGSTYSGRTQIYTWDGNYVGQIGAVSGEEACQNSDGTVGVAWHNNRFYVSSDNSPHGISVFKQCNVLAPQSGPDVIPTMVPTPD